MPVTGSAHRPLIRRLTHPRRLCVLIAGGGVVWLNYVRIWASHFICVCAVSAVTSERPHGSRGDVGCTKRPQTKVLPWGVCCWGLPVPWGTAPQRPGITAGPRQGSVCALLRAAPVSPHWKATLQMLHPAVQWCCKDWGGDIRSGCSRQHRDFGRKALWVFFLPVTCHSALSCRGHGVQAP